MTSPAFGELIKDLQHEMSTVGDIKEANRTSPFKDHLAMVAEGMGALQWVVFEGKPADYVADVLGGVQLFGNRVLKEYKEKCVFFPFPSLKTILADTPLIQGSGTRRIRPVLLRSLEEPAGLHPQKLPFWRDMEQLSCRH